MIFGWRKLRAQFDWPLAGAIFAITVLGMVKLFSGDPLDLALRPWRYVGAALALFAVPAALIIKQPDLGTALILYLVATTVLMLVPVQLHVKLLTLGLELFGGIILFLFKLHGY